MLAGVCFCYNQEKSDSYIPYEKIEGKKKRNQVTKLNNENSESKVSELGSDRLWTH